MTGFTIADGVVTSPTGDVFVPCGINIYWSQLSTAVTNSAGQPLTELFPDLNIIRLNYLDPDGETDVPPSSSTTGGLEPMVTNLTALGIVVVLEDHTGISNTPYTGSDLTEELSWYSSLATTYLDNPYVWFGTFNEPGDGSDLAGISVQQQAIYSAIRDTGNTSPILMELPGGGNPSLVGVDAVGYDGAGPMTASTYATMTNIIWDFHFYGWSSDFSTETSAIQASLLGSVSSASGILAAQSIVSAGGLVPVIIGEFGISSDGTDVDANGTQVVSVVLSSGYGYCAWGFDPGVSDVLVDTSTDPLSLTTYGSQVEAGIVGDQTPTPTPSPTATTTVQVILTPADGDSWVVPENVSELTLIECWGPGGGGWLGGGGGGAYASVTNFPVLAGANLGMSIGTGGSVAAFLASPGNDGSGPTWFNSTALVMADYGRGCQSGTTEATNIGLGGSVANSFASPLYGGIIYAGGQGAYGNQNSDVTDYSNAAGGGGGAGSPNGAGSAGLSNYAQPSGPAQAGNGGDAGSGGGAGGAGSTASTSPDWNGAAGVSNANGGGGGAASSYNGTTGETAEGGSAGAGGNPGGGGGGAYGLAANGADGQIRLTYEIPATSTSGLTTLGIPGLVALSVQAQIGIFPNDVVLGPSVVLPTLPTYAETDYLQTFLNLLPNGRIWDKEVGSPMYQAISALIPTISTFSQDATNLLADAFIASTEELLPEWQASLGLPDPCDDQGTMSTAQQRNQAVARFIGLGGQSVEFFVSYAATLGYQIEITQFMPFYVGINGAGQALAGENAAFLWEVSSPDTGAWLFEVGVDGAGEALGGVDGTSVLQCEIENLAPAHTQVFFSVA